MNPLKPILVLFVLSAIAFGCSKNNNTQPATTPPPSEDTIPWSKLAGTRMYTGYSLSGTHTTGQTDSHYVAGNITLARISYDSMLVSSSSFLSAPVRLWIDTTDTVTGCVIFADQRSYKASGPDVHGIIYYIQNDSIVYLNHWYWPGGFYDYVLDARSNH